MPAVIPARIKGQIEELIKVYHTPRVFHRRLQDLFSLYANRVLHQGDTSQPVTVSPKYHLPPPLIRQLHADLKPRIVKSPHASLELAEELWPDPHYEIKQLAIFMLGNVVLNEPDPILTRLINWLDPELDEGLKSDLLSIGTLTLQNKFPAAWENLIQSLLDHKDPTMIAYGLRGLQTSFKRSDFNNFPQAFRLLSPIIQKPDSSCMEELQNLVEALIKLSPIETAFFIKQSLSISRSAETTRLIKRILPSFPERIRENIKSSINL
ncbi:MAG: hypothetical protein P1P73_08850 [Brevefilum sp.]|nr:hypothetical protein [Brevefilum sp.]